MSSPSTIATEPSSHRARGLEVAGYVLETRVGSGGMGEVWAATRAKDGERVALKFIKASGDEKQRKRFLREIQAAMAIDHPNVIEVYEVVDSEDGAPVMVMELLEGESLGARMKREGQLGLAEVAAIMLPVVSAVGTAHAEGIIHRDIKPENIFLAKTPDGGCRVMVLDFGLAKLASRDEEPDTSGLTTTGSIIGTPWYMAPEQVFAEQDLDQRVDVWALGLILYQALSAILPTQAGNVGQVLKIILTRPVWSLADADPELPRDVTELVDRMLARRRADRMHDLREVVAVLRRYTDVEAPEFGPPALAPASDGDIEVGESAVDALAATVRVSSASLKVTRRRTGWQWFVGAALVAGAASYVLAQRSTEDAPVVPASPSAPVEEVAPPIATPANPATSAFDAPAEVVSAQPSKKLASVRSTASTQPSVAPTVPPPGSAEPVSEERTVGGVVTKSPW